MSLVNSFVAPLFTPPRVLVVEILQFADGSRMSTSPTDTGVTSVAAVGSTPAAAGASISGSVLTLQPADATHPGLLTTGAQSIAGVKTLTSVPVAAGLSAPAATGLTLTSAIADSGTNVGLIVDNSTALTTAGRFLLQLKNATVVNFAVDALGAVLPSAQRSAAQGAMFLGWNGSGNGTMLNFSRGDTTVTGGQSIAVDNDGFSMVVRSQLATSFRLGGNTATLDIVSGILDLTGSAAQTSTKIKMGYTATSGAGTSQSANTPSGRFTLASGQSVFTYTNTLVSATSIVMVQNETALSTALTYKVVPGSNSFVLTTGAAAPTDLLFSFMVIN